LPNTRESKNEQKNIIHVIKLWAGQKEALVNNKQVNLDTFALVVNGRTMVPLRFILEN
jgi:hypothetical protein